MHYMWFKLYCQISSYLVSYIELKWCSNKIFKKYQKTPAMTSMLLRKFGDIAVNENNAASYWLLVGIPLPLVQSQHMYQIFCSKCRSNIQYGVRMGIFFMINITNYSQNRPINRHLAPI